MKDRLVAGGLAGMIAGIIQFGYGMAALQLGITDRIFGQLSDIIFGGQVYSGPLGLLLSILTHLAVTMALGVLYAYIIAKTSSRYYVLKSIGYGFLLWFFLSGFGSILRLPLFWGIPLQPAFVILGGAILYGLVLGYTLKIIDRKGKLL